MANAIRITVIDAAGDLVVAADEVVPRPATRASRDLWRVGWRPTPMPVPASDGQVIVVSPVLPEQVAAGRWTPSLAPWTGEPADVVLLPPTGSESSAGAQEAAAWTLRELGILAGQSRWQSVRAVIVTGSARSVAEGDVSTIEHSGITGLVRAAQGEQSGRFLLADFPAGADVSLAADLIGSDEPEVAVRAGCVHISHYVPLPPPSPRPPARELGQGTCLITGGTGGLGRLIVRHAVTSWGYRRLVLASRRALAAAGIADLTTELRSLGSEVRVVGCDLGDPAAVRRLVAEIPDLEAVVHAAGGSANGLVSDLSAGDLSAAWRAKADGAWALHEAVADRELAAYVLVSSAGGQVMAAGQGSYAAANTFLDGLAKARRSQGRVATAVAFGLWRTQTGLSSLLREQDWRRLEEGGFPPLAPEHALALLDEAVASGAPTVTALRIDRAGLRTRVEVPALVRDLVPRPRQTTARTTSTTLSVGGPAVISSTDGRLRQRLPALAC